MSCPYCGITFSLDGVNADHSFPHFGRLPFHGSPSAGDPGERHYSITSHKCPECRKQIMWLNDIEMKEGEPEIVSTTLLFPKYPVKQIPSDIPEKFGADFREAHDTLPISPKASAALSRRCLQNVIREQESILERTLLTEIDELIKLNKLPKYLADDLDAIRNIGNFAAHPMKDINTGQILEVEPGEAEWTLKVLEDLLLFYFVDRPKSAARRAALDQKLKDAGKRPMLES